MKNIIAIVISLGLSSSLWALQSIQTRYTFDDLDRYWQLAVVKEQSKDASFDQFAQLLKRPDLLKENAGVFKSQELAFEIYLSKEVLYVPQIPQSDEMDKEHALRIRQANSLNQNEIQKRRYQAKLQLAAINFAEAVNNSSMPHKCRYGKKFLSLASGALGLFEGVSVDQDILRLAELHEYVSEGLSEGLNDIQVKVYCQVSEAVETVSVRALVETEINNRIMERLAKEREGTIEPIAALLDHTIRPTKNDAYQISPLTREILEFESQLGATAAALEIVSKDDFKVEELLKQLPQDFSSIRDVSKSGFKPEELKTTDQNLLRLEREIGKFVAELAAIAEAAPASHKDQLALCREPQVHVRRLLEEIRVQAESQVEVKAPLSPKSLFQSTEECMHAINRAVSELSKKDQLKEFSEAFAKDLKSLANILISINKAE